MAVEPLTGNNNAAARMSLISVPEIRVRQCNSAPVCPDSRFVLYWMIAFRRATWNFALDRAVEWAERLQKPLVVLEALRCDYPWASDRMHSFALDGMAENACWFEGTGVLHYPFVELDRNAGNGLLRAMSEHASIVITDDFPCFFLPRMIAAAASQVPVRMEAVDSNGLLPLRASDQDFSTAYSLRRFLQKKLPLHLMEFPKANPLANAQIPAATGVPREITVKWPRMSARLLNGDRSFLAKIPINQSVPRVAGRGGTSAAQALLREFVENKLDAYLEERNEPDRDATSNLSPYLHFGHISAHQIFSEITRREAWSLEHLRLRATGSRTGWWGISQTAEAFLDQLITWRELGFNFCSQRNDYDQFDSLPEWARKTLRGHARDERAYVYTLDEFEQAATHDPLWNAAQTQLAREGSIHKYLRMLWGKLILEWTPSPSKALEIMVELNNKYALDGRDPSSYTGIFWCLGRYDRAWGPERSVFGTVRYMSSTNTAKKLNVEDYLRKYGTNPGNRHMDIQRRTQRVAIR
jgi:deoxyribodipyrimidine photo-lyase